MTPAETQALISFIKEKWKSQKCPYCQEDNWNVSDSVFQLTKYANGNMIIGGPVLPVIPIICTNCGNTTMINALISKTIQPSEAKQKDKNKEAS